MFYSPLHLSTAQCNYYHFQKPKANPSAKDSFTISIINSKGMAGSNGVTQCVSQEGNPRCDQ